MRAVRELAAARCARYCRSAADLFDLPVVAADATSIEIAAVMAGHAQPDRRRRGRFPVRRGGRGRRPCWSTLLGDRAGALTTWLVVAAFVAAYVLIATERIHRVAAALGGAAAMVVLGVVDADTAFFSEDTGVDWNVIFLLLGMMIIVSVVKQTGVFEYLAIWSAKRARGRPFRGDGDAGA